MRNWIVLILLTYQVTWAQTDYKAESIPAALKENAHAVIRQHELTFTVKSPGEASQRVHSVITVLDQEGDSHAATVVGYDKLSKVVTLEGALYDAGGKLVKKLKKSDIEDNSTYSDYNLFDDQRLKSASFPKQLSYPYTVEFSVETTERNLMFYPTWVPQDEEHLALQQAVFTVNMPPGLPLRYKEMNLPTPGKVTTQPDGSKQYNWKIEQRTAIEFEPQSPPVREQIPIVYTAPVEFDVQGYKGKMTDWADVGRFYHTLNDGRDRIPDDLKRTINELTKAEVTTRGKVKKLYQFVQDQTRYVSVQLGIGGWQTVEAEKVALSKYGDCKALTNYTKALLKAAGVVAYPALVRAGDDEPDALTDFPSFQFNHVILCVPDGRDTLFLECTSGNNPAGYMSDFTGNRHVLLILPDGSKLIKTPAYQPNDNLQQRHCQVSVNEQGDATATVRTRYTGLQQDSYASVLHRLNRDEQRSWLLKRITIPAFELTSFAHSEQVIDVIPEVTETLELVIRRWATTSGTRLFLPLNLMSALSTVSSPALERKTPFELGAEHDFEDSDTITYQLPKGYAPEFNLAPVSLTSQFGEYEAHLTVEGERVNYIRRVRMHQGRFPATAYREWIDFRKKIAKADRTQLVFVKKN